MAGYSGSGAQRASGTNGLAVAGLVCGIVGLFILPIILGPLAVVFGAVALRQTRSAMPKWDIGLGMADLVLVVVTFAVAVHNDGGFFWHVG
ncbi:MULTISPECIES: DUF4190 domain-containing protein [unclassified Streptomyces]|uniref:DUF4190 domain-containing protein n=1 Tax=unclassified Streptomyces TaxID=2593676 RepID=UPI0011CD79F0|nr:MULTISPECIES: DUF4190 domain-containing protein [unclassified Streptomyces]TXS68868.1 hypothetical protein EAO69_27190 [Streptomyces sp. me109]